MSWASWFLKAIYILSILFVGHTHTIIHALVMWVIVTSIIIIKYPNKRVLSYYHNTLWLVEELFTIFAFELFTLATNNHYRTLIQCPTFLDIPITKRALALIALLLHPYILLFQLSSILLHLEYNEPSVSSLVSPSASTSNPLCTASNAAVLSAVCLSARGWLKGVQVRDCCKYIPFFFWFDYSEWRFAFSFYWQQFGTRLSHL